jgi:hypothetical protein
VEEPQKPRDNGVARCAEARWMVAPCTAVYWILDMAFFIGLATAIPSSILLLWLRLDAAASVAAGAALGTLASLTYLAWACRQYHKQASSALAPEALASRRSSAQRAAGSTPS